MLSYTGSRNLFGTLTTGNTTDTANLTIADTLINIFLRKILRLRNWAFLQRTASITTVASTQFYDIPFNFKKVLADPYITIGTTQYPIREAPNRAFWDSLNSSTSTTTTIPEYYFIFNRDIGFYPKPSTASYTITLPYYIRQRDLNVADYTTGNITTATNADETIVGGSTSWTSQMAGRWLRITHADGASTGDGEWYEIDSVTNTTNLELVEKYNGTSIAAGSAAYTIGQMSVLPEEFHEVPVYGALWVYFTSIRPDPTRATLYKDLFTEGVIDLGNDQSNKSDSPVITEASVLDFFNPNLFITT